MPGSLARTGVHLGSQGEGENKQSFASSHPRLTGAGLFLFVPGLLSASLASQSFLDSALFPGFEVEGVFLNLLNDIFLLNLPLKTAESVF